jgi:hypothetical protein
LYGLNRIKTGIRRDRNHTKTRTLDYTPTMTDVQSMAQHHHHHHHNHNQHHLAPREQQQQHTGMAGTEGLRQPVAEGTALSQSQMNATRTEQDSAVAAATAASASMPINEQEIGQYKEQDRFLPVRPFL